MQKLFILLVCLSMSLCFVGKIFSEAIPPEIGKINTYVSDNGMYSVEIKILGYPDSSPSECTFKKGDQILWSKEIPNTPGKVAISDNGKHIAMVNWGWYDEMGSKSLSLYDGTGELIKEVFFYTDEFGQSSMRWVRNLAISPDGEFCMIADDGESQATFSLYEVKTGNLIWDKDFGFADVTSVEIADKAEYILLATNDYDTQNMKFYLLNYNGDILWEKEIPENFSYDVEDYLNFKPGTNEFEVYSLASQKYLVQPLVNKK